MKTLWQRWRGLARKAGNFQARVFLTVFYFTLAAPFGFGIRWFSDPLRLRRAHGSPEWRPREPRESDAAEMRSQF